jgi:hypothetical protein
MAGHRAHLQAPRAGSPTRLMANPMHGKAIWRLVRRCGGAAGWPLGRELAVNGLPDRLQAAIRRRASRERDEVPLSMIVV